MVQIHDHREVIALFWSNYVRAILAVKHLLRSVLDKLVVAPDGDRNEDLALGLSVRDMEGDAVKVGYYLVKVTLRSAAGRVNFTVLYRMITRIYPEKRSFSSDSISTFW